MTNRVFLGATLTVLALLAGLAVALARLEWNWLRTIENYEHLRLDSTAGREIFSLKRAFESEIEALAGCLRVPSGSREDIAAALGEHLARWRRSARWPGLFDRASLWIDGARPTTLDFEPEASRFVELATAAERPRLPPETPRPTFFHVDTRLPAVFTAVWVSEEGGGKPTPAWLVIRLNDAELRERLLPELVDAILPRRSDLDRGPFATRFHYAERSVVIVEARSGEILYSTEPIASLAEFGRPEGAYGLVDAGTDGEELPRVGRRPPRGREAIPDPDRPASAAEHDWFRNVWAHGYYSGHWQVFYKSGATAIADQVAATRTRGAWLAFGVLGAIVGLGVLACVLALRAGRLARDQMAFLASVSHELRSPLAALSAAGENLADSLCEEPGKSREYGRMIRDETQRLREMVENVLHFARRRAAAPRPALRSLEVETLVKDALGRMRRTFEQAGFEIELDLPGDSPRVRGDLRALQSALANLLSNALKYGLPGRWLRVAVQAKSSEVEIVVEDRGPGIEARDRRRLFEPFFRGRRARAEQAEGSGLGLAVVQDVAALHGGRITVQSRTGGGSRFVLHLPREEEP